MRPTAAVLLAPLLGCLLLDACTVGATSPDADNPRLCRTVQQQAPVVLDQLRSGSPAAAPTLDQLAGTLAVRDTDTSDQMRGDALVLQLNVTTARQALAAGRPPDVAMLQEAFRTFVIRECG
jgi:hypothetical protein